MHLLGASKSESTVEVETVAEANEVATRPVE